MYKLTDFGSVELPVAAPKHTAGTMGTSLRLVKVLGGGVYDADGSGQAAPELPFEIAYECKAVASTAAALRTTLDALRALRGTEARLWREAFSNGDRQWALARCVSVDFDTEARHSHGRFQPLTMVFLVKTLWRGVLHGASWYLNTGRYLNTGLYLNMAERIALNTATKTITVTNGGNTYTDEVLLTLEAGATPVTGLTITCGSCQLVWSGTVAANKSLVIDCEPLRRSVLNDGVAAYSLFDTGPSHTSEVWMRLVEGANSMVVARTGGGTDTYLTIAFSDAWE
jgi:hypothetical protein